MCSAVASLTFLAVRSIALRLFQTNIRWRKISDVAFTLRDVLHNEWKVPPRIRQLIINGLTKILAEVRRWDEKHRQLFIETGKKRLMSRGEQLRTFYNLLIWKDSCYLIDDFSTALFLIQTECNNWAQLKFQFAAVYAMEDLLTREIIVDKYRLVAFKKQLSDHPVYDFWLTLLESNWDIFFDTETRIANQKLQLCFQFAIRNGYSQLVEFIWNKIGNTTREYIGFLQWRSLCFRTRDRDTIKFLCVKLCEMNPVSMARISYTMFWSTFYDMMNNEQGDIVVREKFKHKFNFLLENCCPELKKRLLSMDNYRIVSDAFRYKRSDTFHTILSNLEGDELRQATEVIDRIHGRKPSREGNSLRKAMLRKQASENGLPPALY